MRRWQKFCLTMTGLVFAGLLVWRLSNNFSTRPTQIPLTAEYLAEVPDRPNCVSSEVPEDAPSYIAPLNVSGRQRPIERVATIVRGMPGVTIIRQTEQMLICEFRTPLMNFVDDVDLVLDDQGERICVRSASRVGYSDLGKNRARIEAIRNLWDAVDQ